MSSLATLLAKRAAQYEAYQAKKQLIKVFKAGAWSAVPVDSGLKYAYDTAKDRFKRWRHPELAVDSRNKMGYSRRRLSSRRGTTRAVGHAPGSSLNKHAITCSVWDTAGTPYNAAQLYSRIITGIRQSGNDSGQGVDVGEDDINLRQRQMINLMSLNVRGVMSSTLPDRAGYFHWAIISPKKPPPIVDGNDGTVTLTQTNIDTFFRGYGLSRAQGFASTLDAAELNYSPINVDAYHVLYKKRMYIGTDTVTNAAPLFDANAKNFKLINTTVKINRQIRYYGRKPQECEDPLYLVHWFVPVNWTGGEAAVSSAYSFKFKVFAAFKEPGE